MALLQIGIHAIPASMALAERLDALSLHHVRAREWKGELVLLQWGAELGATGQLADQTAQPQLLVFEQGIAGDRHLAAAIQVLVQGALGGHSQGRFAVVQRRQQGMNLGIQDVRDLTDVLSHASSLGSDLGSVAVLDAYESKRGTPLLAKTMVNDLLHRLFIPASPLHMMPPSLQPERLLASIRTGAAWHRPTLVDSVRRVGLGWLPSAVRSQLARFAGHE